jgi:O-antigen/teichoic acid export membrane protein
MIGAVVNIVLNLFLIPLYGMTGAAIATLFSYSILPFGLLFLKQFREDVKTLRNQKI